MDLKFLWKPTVKKFERRPIVVTEENDTWGVDLIDYSQDPWPGFAIVCIDYFTRFVYAELLSTKSQEAITKALNTIFQTATPKKIHADKEAGLIHNTMLKHRGIVVYHTEFMGSPIAERVIRTLRGKIEQERRTSKIQSWKPVLKRAVAEYNDSKHRFMNMSPNDAQGNTEDVQRIQFEHATEQRKEPSQRLHVGDKVVVVREKKRFEKGFTQTFAKTVRMIQQVKPTNPVTYVLDDGSMHYIQELQKVTEMQLKALKSSQAKSLK